MPEIASLSPVLPPEANQGPVRSIDEAPSSGPRPGIALCLSGGGYRAMLFHLGSLWRLNELGVLRKISRVSSVSGGSITAAAVGVKWSELRRENFSPAAFKTLVAEPIRELACHSIDWPSVLKAPLWFGSAGHRVAEYYREYLYGDATLQDLPDDADGPRFVINATNLQSGVLWRFMKPYMRDYRVGEIKSPKIDLAIAVAASSAFPPPLSPMTLRFREREYSSKGALGGKDVNYLERVMLTDGGVYDNLGLETAWKKFNTILVSDAGLGLKDEPRPWKFWPAQAVRVLFTIDGQVRSLRRRQVIDSLNAGERDGAFWGIDTDPQKFPSGSLKFDPARAEELANLSTRLGRLDAETQCRLINWGYLCADAWLRYRYMPTTPPATQFPYPKHGV